MSQTVSVVDLGVAMDEDVAEGDYVVVFSALEGL